MTCIRRPFSYWTSCRCPDCTLDYYRKSKHQKAGILPPRVSSEDAWRALDAMVARGWDPRAIASATGLNRGTLRNALYAAARGERRTFGPRTSAMIVNAKKPTEGMVGATGSARRLRGLAVLGHSVQSVADAAGISIATVSRIRAGDTARVDLAVAHGVARAHAELSMQLGTCTRARREAVEAGWAPPLAWDEDAIDDPKARPRVGPRVERYRHVDEVAVEEAVAGRRVRLTVHERREAVLRMRRLGLSSREIGDRLGMTTEAARRLGSRATRRATEAAA